ncbi:MAG: hypothetical protein RXS25_31850, partial [Paraburkholderia sp.]|uniref:hypothetical protein n=1 Tax=Paraburkholderia sp. TaxID=1926495 RepID=UPI003977F25B
THPGRKSPLHYWHGRGFSFKIRVLPFFTTGPCTRSPMGLPSAIEELDQNFESKELTCVTVMVCGN